MKNGADVGPLLDLDDGRSTKAGSIACATSLTASDRIVRAGSQWRMMPHDLPPWSIVYQQTRTLGSKRAALKLSFMMCVRYARLAAERSAQPRASHF